MRSWGTLRSWFSSSAAACTRLVLVPGAKLAAVWQLEQAWGETGSNSVWARSALGSPTGASGEGRSRVWVGVGGEASGAGEVGVRGPSLSGRRGGRPLPAHNSAV